MNRSSRRRPEPRVTQRNLGRAVGALTRVDPDLAAVVEKHGRPPLWARRPGFATLVHIILEQQVSLASARAAYDRLLAAVSPLEPAGFLELDDGELLAIGFSRQKADYCRGLAQAIEEGRLDLAALSGAAPAEARRELLALRGVGPWTADIYLLMVLGHRDVWPVGDLALAKAMRSVKGLAETPRAEDQLRVAEPWRPWRSVAARLLWHHYLETRANGANP